MNLSTTYLGLKLKNPIIVSSCGLTYSIENLKRIEKAGAAAVVLKSLFEEQIMFETDKLLKTTESGYYYPEAEDYIVNYSKQHSIEEYLDFIKLAKASISIPVIASINCVSSSEWTSFAKRIQEAGADALEINIFILPSDAEVNPEDNEKIYFDIIKEVLKNTSLPIAVKIGQHFSGLAKTAVKLSWSGIKGIVLFNRFFSPDIDVERMELTSANIFSSSQDFSNVLRWTAILSDKVHCDIAASTGIHSGETAFKLLLSGAKTVEIASVLYKNGIEYISVMLKDIEEIMYKGGHQNIQDIIGKMSYRKAKNPGSYLRVQFMKYFAGIE